MSINPQALVGEGVTYHPLYMEEEKVTTVTSVKVFSKIGYGPNVFLILANGDQIPASHAKFDLPFFVNAKG